LIRIGREQLAPYGVEICETTVGAVVRQNDSFQVATSGGVKLTSRRVLLATGVVDRLPEIEGIESLYGKSVHHCPYCDGWEHRDQPIAVYGKGRRGLGLAKALKTWSDDLVLCSDGPAGLSREERAELEALDIPLYTSKIDRLEGNDGDLERIVFATGESIARRAMFFNTGQHQMCSLAGQLGCAFTKRGAIKTDRFERTNIPGVFAVGDCSRNVQFVSVAAAQGAIAAQAINQELQEEDRQRYLAQKRIRSSGGA
jgi:thioredoxin reductase